MKPITEKQIEAIQKLARVTKTEVGNINGMSRVDASNVITALIEKMNKDRGNPGDEKDGPRNDTKKTENHDYRSDALAGLAVKILAQRCEIEEIVGDGDRFRKRAMELFKVFDSARNACLA